MPVTGARHRPRLRSAWWLPLFDDLADPVVVARLAGEAEEAGWHGVFVWDHLRWRAPVRQVADAWITLAAVVPPRAGAAARRAGVGCRVPGQRQAAAPGRPLPGVLRRSFTEDQLATIYQYLSAPAGPSGGGMLLVGYGCQVQAVAPDATATPSATWS